MSVPAARIRTASGWRDIAIQGAPGIPGFTPSARAHSAAFAITADSNARFYTPAMTIDWNDLGGSAFTANPGMFTAPVAGKYLVGFTIDQLAPGNVSLAMIINGTTVPKRVTYGTATGADGTKGGIEEWGIFNLNAGDNLRIHGWSTGGGSTNVLTIEVIRLDAPGVSLPSNAPQYFTPAQFAALTPVNGLEVYLIVDAANGIIWHLRYNAASASVYKWEFLGGSDLMNYVAASVGSSSAVYGGSGPSVTVPLAGDYDVSIGCRTYISTDAASANMSFAVGATAAADADSIQYFSGASAITGASTTGQSYRTVRKTGIAAGSLIDCRYRSQTGGANTSWDFRDLRVRPIRVG